MLILFWLIVRIIFIITAVTLILYLIRCSKDKNSFSTLLNGIKSGLKEWGFTMNKTRYPVELYKWVTCDDEEICEDCVERAGWPAMDIADWMKAGLPGTPEAHTECGEDCRCELVFYQTTVPSEKNSH